MNHRNVFSYSSRSWKSEIRVRSLSLACRLLPFSLCSHMAERETASESEMSARASEQERDTSCLMSLLMRTQILSYWRRKWQPTPVFLPGESYREAWWATTCGVAESGMTEHAHTHPILKVLPSGPQVTIITSQRPPSLNTITVSVRASTHAF